MVIHLTSRKSLKKQSSKSKLVVWSLLELLVEKQAIQGAILTHVRYLFYQEMNHPMQVPTIFINCKDNQGQLAQIMISNFEMPKGVRQKLCLCDSTGRTLVCTGK